MDQRFRRAERVRLKREFDRLFREGRSFHSPELMVKAAPNGMDRARLGLSVGRRLGNAVRRNRIKRLLRESWRRNKSALSVPCDMVIVPRSEWRNLTLGAIEPVVRGLLVRINDAFAAR